MLNPLQGIIAEISAGEDKTKPALAGLEVGSAQDGIGKLMLALFNLLEDVMHLVHHFLVCGSALLCPGAQSAF